jgi:DNA repair protein RecO (recombination protein O)
MQLEDEGILLTVAPFKESHALVSIFTPQHGMLRGMVKGALSKRRRSEFQPGTLMQLRWHARLEEHLGTISCESIGGVAAAACLKRDRCYALQSLTQMLPLVLIERDPHPELYRAALQLLQAMHLADESWYAAWIRFEHTLLSESGFGLELSECAATGSSSDLFYLSPKSGQAVCKSAGAPYHDKLFVLPQSWHGHDTGCVQDFAQGLSITGYFIETRLLAALDKTLPAARRHLERVVAQAAQGMREAAPALHQTVTQPA